jgi:predicted RNase H-like HicB family nuclease
MRQVIIYPGEDGYWVAECPSLPGCVSQGKSKEEAIANIREAIQGYVAALEEDNLPVPEERFEALMVAVLRPLAPCGVRQSAAERAGSPSADALSTGRSPAGLHRPDHPNL